MSSGQASRLDLSGRVALVTGGSRGIGAACARLLAARGAAVAINYTSASSEALAGALAEQIAAEGGRALALRFDVAEPEAIAAGVAQVVETLGGLHVLVNNAGISIDALMLRARPEDFSRQLAVNLQGAYECCRVALRHLLKAKTAGRIVNLSSVVGEAGNPGQTMYAATKAGLLGLTKSLALELASRGITVNAVSPGFIDTDMTAASLDEAARAALLGRIPMGRTGRAEEVAEAVAWLASDAASYVTGQIIRVNGGMLL